MFTVSGLVRIYQVVRCKVIRQTRFNDTYCTIEATKS